MCEALTVDKMKDEIISGGTIYQIGGIPGHRREEHLVVVKSLIQLKLSRKTGCIGQLADFEKFFDSENLQGLMGSLSEAEVNSKAYRIWYKLNEKAVISVKSPAGISEKGEAGKICPQGGFGGALASGLDLAVGCKAYFEGSQDEISYGRVRCNPQLYQDDLLRVADSVESARAGNMRLLNMVRERQLSCHPSKTCYVIFGSQGYISKVKEQVAKEPIMLGDQITKPSKAEVYLGDVLAEGSSLAASTEASVARNMARCKGAMFEVHSIMEDFRIQAIGGMAGAWDLWEAGICASLLANCSTWVKMSPETVKSLNQFQNQYLRMIYSCPPSTPLCALGSLGWLRRSGSRRSISWQSSYTGRRPPTTAGRCWRSRC